jgi:hypothetical protein
MAHVRRGGRISSSPCRSSNPKNRFALDRSIAVLSSRDYGILFQLRRLGASL